jgi:S-adenosylmethionine decarboxylase
MLDGYMGEVDLLDSEAQILKWLNDLPDLLGMHKITEPVVVHADPNGLNDPGGYSGYVMIAESHISVHTFVGRRFASADVYTCKNGMDIKFIEEFFKKTFGFEEMEVNFVKRGTRYPASDLI